MHVQSLDDVAMFDGFVTLHKAIITSAHDPDAAWVLLHYRDESDAKRKSPPEEIVLRVYRKDAHGWGPLGALAHRASIWRAIGADVAAVCGRAEAEAPPVASLAAVSVELRAVLQSRFVQVNDKRAVGVFLLAPNRAGPDAENDVMIRELRLRRAGWHPASWLTFRERVASDVAAAVARFG